MVFHISNEPIYITIDDQQVYIQSNIVLFSEQPAIFTNVISKNEKQESYTTFLTVNGYVCDVRGTCADLVKRLKHSRWGRVEITPLEVEQILVDAVKTGKAEKFGENSYQVFWLTNSELEGKKVDAYSKFIVIPDTSILRDLSDKGDKKIREMLYKTEMGKLETELRSKIEKELASESFIERIKKKLKKVD
jgi:hypothetical protein